MKIIYWLAASFCLAPALASAADAYPPEEMPYLPASAPILSWAGPYAGGHLGYQWGLSSTITRDPGSARTFQQPGYSDAGVSGGLHAGYAWQTNQFVYGLEGDIDGSSYNGSVQSLGNLRIETHENIMGSLRARAGYAWNRFLVYGTGGAAFGLYRNGSSVQSEGVYNIDESLRVGWTVGAGVEYAVNNDWSVRAEYRYTDTGHYTEYAFGTVTHHQTDNRVQAGLSYKFDGFAAPPALYARY